MLESKFESSTIWFGTPNCLSLLATNSNLSYWRTTVEVNEHNDRRQAGKKKEDRTNIDKEKEKILRQKLLPLFDLVKHTSSREKK